TPTGGKHPWRPPEAHRCTSATRQDCGTTALAGPGPESASGENGPEAAVAAEPLGLGGWGGGPTGGSRPFSPAAGVRGQARFTVASRGREQEWRHRTQKRSVSQGYQDSGRDAGQGTGRNHRQAGSSPSSQEPGEYGPF